MGKSKVGYTAVIALAGITQLALVTTSATAQTESTAIGGGGKESSSEIIVTAQRREERLRDVPMAITALSGDALVKAGVSNTLELSLVTPGLEMPMYGGYTQPSIRGISSAGAGLADSSNVAVYLDGVYQPSQSGQLADLPNVQDIQVLKGPQGTLYGQNATGGAIIINTITPQFTPKGDFAVSYGNYDDMTARGYVTGPITSQLAGMVSAAWQDRNGFNHNLLRGGHDKGLRAHQFRGKLLWTPDGGGNSVTLSAFYTRRNDSTPYAGQPYHDISIGTPLVQIYGLPFPAKPHQYTHNIEPDIRIRTYGISLLGKFTLGDIGTLNTSTAYGNVRVAYVQDTDVTGVNLSALSNFVTKQHNFIQEVNFISSDLGGLTFSAGLFFMRNQEKYDPYVFSMYGGSAWPDNPPPLFDIGNHTANKRRYYAAYLEATYAFTDTLTLTVGGRYSSERQKAYGAALPDPSPYPDPRGSFTFSKFTPRAVLRFKPDGDTMLYASISQGFKSGFIDANAIYPCYDPVVGHAVQCVPPTDPVKPEVLTAYELGYKAKPLSGLSLSLSAFHYDYKDIQVFNYQPGSGIGKYLNAAKARVNGIEFDTVVRVSQSLTLRAGAVWLDAKYRSFPEALSFVPYGTVIDGVPVTCTDSSPGGNCTIPVDASGRRMMRAPKLSFTFGADAEHRFDRVLLGASLNIKYTSGLYFDPVEDIRQGRYALINGRIYVEPDILSGVRLSFYGKNLTNKAYLSSVLASTISNAVSYAAPRQYGIEAAYRF